MAAYQPGEVYYEWNHEFNRMGDVYKVVSATGSGRRGLQVTFFVDGKGAMTFKGDEIMEKKLIYDATATKKAEMKKAESGDGLATVDVEADGGGQPKPKKPKAKGAAAAASGWMASSR